MSTLHQLVVAARSDSALESATPLEARLGAIEGVEVRGAFRGRVTLSATPEALAEIRRRFGDSVHIEEAEARRLPD